jgi:hypothetical protein
VSFFIHNAIFDDMPWFAPAATAGLAMMICWPLMALIDWRISR